MKFLTPRDALKIRCIKRHTGREDDLSSRRTSRFMRPTFKASRGVKSITDNLPWKSAKSMQSADTLPR